LEVVRASLFSMNMPWFYWGEAVKSVTYLINRTLFSVIDFQTLQQKMHSFFSLSHFPNLEPRVLGCIVYVHIPKNLRTKLDLCAKQCVFVGYSEFQKGYRCYDPQTQKLHVTLDALFRETELYYSGNFSGPSLKGETYTEENGLQKGEGGNKLIELEEVNIWH
jgi:hypothetical protein